MLRPEVNMDTSGRFEYTYVTVGEEIEIKLNAQHFSMVSTDVKQCVNDENYSAVKCMEMYAFEKAIENLQCSGPWMKKDGLPYCKNFTQMRELIVNYQK